VFAERRSAPPSDEYERNEAAAYHICVYLETAERFAACFRACEAAGLLYANPAYARSPPEFGNAMAWEEVQACGQFRIKELGGSTGEPAALVLEVEVRSPHHVSCPIGKRPR